MSFSLTLPMDVTRNQSPHLRVKLSLNGKIMQQFHPLEIEEVPKTLLGTLRTHQRKDSPPDICSYILTGKKITKKLVRFLHRRTRDTDQENLNHSPSVGNIICPVPPPCPGRLSRNLQILRISRVKQIIPLIKRFSFPRQSQSQLQSIEGGPKKAPKIMEISRDRKPYTVPPLALCYHLC